VIVEPATTHAAEPPEQPEPAWLREAEAALRVAELLRHPPVEPTPDEEPAWLSEAGDRLSRCASVDDATNGESASEPPRAPTRSAAHHHTPHEDETATAAAALTAALTAALSANDARRASVSATVAKLTRELSDSLAATADTPFAPAASALASLDGAACAHRMASTLWPARGVDEHDPVVVIAVRTIETTAPPQVGVSPPTSPHNAEANKRRRTSATRKASPVIEERVEHVSPWWQKLMCACRKRVDQGWPKPRPATLAQAHELYGKA
jgi:hypothetical protein